jgi:hypothetical protein
MSGWVWIDGQVEQAIHRVTHFLYDRGGHTVPGWTDKGGLYVAECSQCSEQFRIELHDDGWYGPSHITHCPVTFDRLKAQATADACAMVTAALINDTNEVNSVATDVALESHPIQRRITLGALAGLAAALLEMLANETEQNLEGLWQGYAIQMQRGVDIDPG